MGQVGEVLMMDGGWGFAISSALDPARRLWLAFPTKEEAVAAHGGMLHLLRKAITMSIVC